MRYRADRREIKHRNKYNDSPRVPLDRNLLLLHTAKLTFRKSQFFFLERQLSADGCILGDGLVAFIAEGVHILTKSGFHLCGARRISRFLLTALNNTEQILREE
jgi:hypothetical protein